MFAVRSLRLASLAAAARPALRRAVPVPAGSGSMLARPAFAYSSSSSSSTPASPSSSSPSSPSSSSSTSSSSSSASSSTPSTPESSPAIEAPAAGAKPQQVAQIEPRLAMTFTCTAGPQREQPVCNHRSTHEFSKRSYTKGIVIVQCPECKARHLIADHLGWFKESTEDGKLRTVEDLLRAKGETIKKGRVTMDGDIEYAPEE